ncbi:hypothetical protein P7K49_001589 [Saguinus oedipus]|uniref:Whirlin n=1 Tax=Saguinus oedipus TaxID=9490 RepID=A0ABQ9WHE3_SAGOE|nr:hypothetical protein P7K49_001589 [Saguinus oedipus]
MSESCLFPQALPVQSPLLSLKAQPRALKGSKKLVLSVYSAGRIPGGYVTNHIYTWVDPQGRCISPPSGLPQSHSGTLRQQEGDRRSTLHLLQGGDEKKLPGKGRKGVSLNSRSPNFPLAQTQVHGHT